MPRRYSEIKRSAAKAWKAKAVPRRFNISASVHRVHDSSLRAEYAASTCIKSSAKSRSVNVPPRIRCTSGLGATPTRALKLALKKLSEGLK